MIERPATRCSDNNNNNNNDSNTNTLLMELERSEGGEAAEAAEAAREEKKLSVKEGEEGKEAEAEVVEEEKEAVRVVDRKPQARLADLEAVDFFDSPPTRERPHDGAELRDEQAARVQQRPVGGENGGPASKRKSRPARSEMKRAKLHQQDNNRSSDLDPDQQEEQLKILDTVKSKFLAHQDSSSEQQQQLKKRSLTSTSSNASGGGDTSSSSPSSSSSASAGGLELPNNNENICAACLKPIKERYLLMALDKQWHEDCLKCACCDCRLGEVGSSLYTHSDKILCRRDFLRIFGQLGHCAACKKSIPPYEMVMRANQNAYHMECFACQQCQYRFCVGDRFHLTEMHRIVCILCHTEQHQQANLGAPISSHTTNHNHHPHHLHHQQHHHQHHHHHHQAYHLRSAMSAGSSNTAPAQPNGADHPYGGPQRQITTDDPFLPPVQTTTSAPRPSGCPTEPLAARTDTAAAAAASSGPQNANFLFGGDQSKLQQQQQQQAAACAM